MSANPKLKDLESHFEFGQNWSEYSELINEARIQKAEESLKTLIGEENIKGKTFLDIGCGSGLFSLSASNLGAKKVTSVDIDPKCVETTRKTLTRFAKSQNFEAQVQSVFDISSEKLGQFDVVYSWGVLHHTGSMYEAIEFASRMVKEGGIFSIALYRKTDFCGMWKIIKRIYTAAPKFIQKIISFIYSGLLLLSVQVSGRNPYKYVKEYDSLRGMSFSHDIHDWLGGYPYESISEKECTDFLNPKGFELIYKNVTTPKNILDRIQQVFGSGCDEYTFRKLK